MARSYQDIVPDCQFEEGEAQDVIEFQLKDFKKDQLKVHFGSNGVILVSGERPVEGGKWIRFRKEFAIPKDFKATEIRARFSSGFLYVTIPKKAVSSDVSQQGPLTPVQQAATGTPSSPVQDKGKLKQENSVGRSGDVDDECSACSTAENAVSPTPRPEWSIWRLKMEGKTAVTSGASLVMAAAGLMFVVLYYAFKYYDPVNKTV